MKTITKLILAGLFIHGLTSCTNNTDINLKTSANDTTANQSFNMKSLISIFEIPATEITRAINFYERILDIQIEKMDIPEMQMGIFPYEGHVITGVLIKADGYKPSADGVTIYLNGGDNLQIILDKVEKNGGKILIPKTPHADENGYFAIFLDSEGNKIGLHSPH